MLKQIDEALQNIFLNLSNSLDRIDKFGNKIFYEMFYKSLYESLILIKLFQNCFISIANKMPITRDIMNETKEINSKSIILIYPFFMIFDICFLYPSWLVIWILETKFNSNQ